jgi:hypothetical protein
MRQMTSCFLFVTSLLAALSLASVSRLAQAEESFDTLPPMACYLITQDLPRDYTGMCVLRQKAFDSGRLMTLVALDGPVGLECYRVEALQKDPDLDDGLILRLAPNPKFVSLTRMGDDTSGTMMMTRLAGGTNPDLTFHRDLVDYRYDVLATAMWGDVTQSSPCLNAMKSP